MITPEQALENYHKEPLEVEHKKLTRASEESNFRSKCPECGEGYLLVQRDQLYPFYIRTTDNCILCGRRFIYTDIIPDISLKYKTE